MLKYVNRKKEVYLKLKGCPAQREVYDALDFHQDYDEKKSHPMTHTKLSELSGTARERIPLVLGQLIEKGLIQTVLVPGKKYVFQYLLLDVRQSEVVQLPGSKSTQRDAEYEASQAEFLNGLGD